MKRRCLEPTFKDWPRYGGAGILICPEWMASFDQFLTDMGLPPSPAHWLGRRDVTAHYTPDNCIWTEQAPQKARRAYCRRVIVSGQTMTAAEAARLPNQPTRNTVIRRWESGFSLDRPAIAKIYRRSMWIRYEGETLPLPAWAKRLGLNSSTLWMRIQRGQSLDQAMTPELQRQPNTTFSKRQL